MDHIVRSSPVTSRPVPDTPHGTAKRADGGGRGKAFGGGRGRPRNFDVGRAEAAASLLFQARGYDRVTLADLTGAMGINPPSFYAAFGNKALLFSRVADAYLADWLMEIRAAFDGAPLLSDALRQIIVAAASRFAWQGERERPRPGKQTGGQGGCLILESANNCSDALVAAHIRKARLSVAAAFYRGISRQAPDEVVALTDHVMMLLAGLSAMARDGVGEDRLVPLANRAARALILGVHPPSYDM